jgi:ketosteroid isomerase-like protein
MPDNNVEIFKRLIEAFNDRGLEGTLEYFDENVEIYDPDLRDGASIKGHAGVISIIGQMVDGFEVMKVEDFEAIPVGDRVVALVRTGGYGEGSRGEMDIELRDAHLMTFRDGKIVYWRLYLNQAEALTDAGLDPSLAERHSQGDVPAP